jgi:hypothetical protein
MLIYAFIINLTLVATTVLIHYETLYYLAKRLPSLHTKPRFRVLGGLYVIILAHIVEIWLFALGYYFMVHVGGFGELSGNVTHGLLDNCYFSFTTYTTLGYGDIQPSGYLRFLAGLESLTGLLMITWSASFMFLEMQKYWPRR